VNQGTRAFAGRNDDIFRDDAGGAIDLESGDGSTSLAEIGLSRDTASSHAAEGGIVAERGANDDGELEYVHKVDGSRPKAVVDPPTSDEKGGSEEKGVLLLGKGGLGTANEASEIGAEVGAKKNEGDFSTGSALMAVGSAAPPSCEIGAHGSELGSEHTQISTEGTERNAAFQSRVAPGAFRIPGPGSSENNNTGAGLSGSDNTDPGLSRSSRSLVDTNRVSMTSVESMDVQSSAIIATATLVTSTHHETEEGPSPSEVVEARRVFKRDGLDCKLLFRDRRIQSFLCVVVAVIVALSVTLSQRNNGENTQVTAANFIPTASPVFVAFPAPSPSPTISKAPTTFPTHTQAPTIFPTHTQAPTIGYPGYVSATKQIFEMIVIVRDRRFGLEGTRRTAFESLVSSFFAQYSQVNPGLVETACNYIGTPSGRTRGSNMEAVDLLFSISWSSRHSRTETYPDDFVRFVNDNLDTIYQEFLQIGIVEVLAIDGIAKVGQPTARPSLSPTPRPTVTQAPTLAEASVSNATYSLIIYITNPYYSFGTNEEYSFCTLMKGYTTSFGPDAGMRGRVSTSCQIANDAEVYRQSGTVYALDVVFGMRWDSIHTNVTTYPEEFFRYVRNRPYSVPDDLVEHGVMKRSDGGGIDRLTWVSGAPPSGS